MCRRCSKTELGSWFIPSDVDDCVLKWAPQGVVRVDVWVLGDDARVTTSNGPLSAGGLRLGGFRARLPSLICLPAALYALPHVPVSLSFLVCVHRRHMHTHPPSILPRDPSRSGWVSADVFAAQRETFAPLANILSIKNNQNLFQNL